MSGEGGREKERVMVYNKVSAGKRECPAIKLGEVIYY
jgi:hypothetical protein